MDTLYPKVLFFTEYPTDSFINTVQWIDPDESFRPISSFGEYNFNNFTENEPLPNHVYICKNDNKNAINFMTDNNMSTIIFDSYILGYIQ